MCISTSIIEACICLRPAVEAACSDVSSQQLDVTAGQHTCSLRCYRNGSNKMYRLLAAPYLRASGAKLGDSFAIYRCGIASHADTVLGC